MLAFHEGLEEVANLMLQLDFLTAGDLWSSDELNEMRYHYVRVWGVNRWPYGNEAF